MTTQKRPLSLFELAVVFLFGAFCMATVWRITDLNDDRQFWKRMASRDAQDEVLRLHQQSGMQPAAIDSALTASAPSADPQWYWSCAGYQCTVWQAPPSVPVMLAKHDQDVAVRTGCVPWIDPSTPISWASTSKMPGPIRGKPLPESQAYSIPIEHGGGPLIDQSGVVMPRDY